MTSFRKAIRFFSLALSIGLPIAASAATFDVKTLIDTDNRRSTGCSVVTPGGIVNGIDVMVTTQGTVTGATGTVTSVTRQTCTNAVLNQFGSPTAVDGGWNVGVSAIGDVTVESHMGLDVLTWDNIGTPRFVFISTSGLSSDVLLTPWSWGGGDIVMPHAARDRSMTPTQQRNILLDGGSSDWAGAVPLANGTAAAPVWRFITASAYAGMHDLFFNFKIHTNPAAPTAHDDNYALGTLGGTLTVATLGVLNNDNPNSQPITASLVDSTQHGTLALAPDGGFVYVHDGSLASQDQFHYVAVGTALSSNLATVTIDLPGTHPYTFTSADNVTFIDGQANTFQVIVTGKPTPGLSFTGDLPAGVTFQDNGNGTGTLSGTPGPNTSGTYPLVFFAEKNKPHQSSQNFTLTVTCPGVSVVNPVVTTGTAGVPFSQTFTQNGGTPPVSFTLNTGTLPPGLTLSTAGVLSGTPTGSGTFPITVKVTDVGGCTGVGPTYNLVITCHTVTVNNPATSTGTVNTAFSQTFTQVGAIGGATFSLNSGTLPAGLTLSSAGVLSGTPTQSGSFPITVKVTDGQGCTGVGPTYTLTIACQTITVTNPATNTGTVNVAFSQTFTAGNTIGAVTFSLNSGTLPAGITLSSAGVLSGTPTQTGSFPITVKATDANGCSGVGATYTLTIACQVITVTNPATNTGTVNVPFSQTFTSGNAIAPVTFTLNSGSLPAGITLSAAGVLSGTPTQTGSFPITVKATDANGCFGVGATYTLTINCQVITVTNPATNTGTVSSPFSQTFTAGNAIAPVTFTLNSGSLPTGITLSAAGVLSGTPTQTGSFPITVKATDANGCTGIGATYTLTINCQVITVTNPATTTGTTGTPLSINFTQTGAIGTATFTTASTLPPGLALATNGTLSGTPTQAGPFPIAVTVTDSNGCTGTNPSYTLTITCPVITVTNPGVSTGTVGAAFNQIFTQSGGTGTTTFSTASTLPTGLTLATNGTLSGTPSQSGTFPIVVTATDANGCTGTGSTYNLVISCPVITVTNPGVTTGTVDAPFSQTFTQTGAFSTATFTTASSLPAGLALSTAGVLSGTPSVPGTFPIVVTVTDSAGCTGSGPTYTLVISCQTITVNNPGVTTGTVDAPFGQTFTQSGVGTHTPATFTLNSGSLPTGLTLSTSGVLSGTPTVPGSFPITVKVTDANGCSGISATYTLVIGCQTITVTNPATTTGTVDAPFSQTFTQSGVGTHTPATFTLNSGSLPAGLTLSTSGVLSGTPTVSGTFPITVKVTDANGCFGISATYTLVIGCQTITVTNPVTNTGTVGVAFSQTFTQSGAHGTATFTTASTLPAGFTLSTAGVLSGITNQHGTFPIVVTVTDSNGCTGASTTYNLTINCQLITVTNPGTTSGPAGTPFSVTFTQTGGIGTITWSETGTLPTGLTFHTATGVLDGTPTQGGSFPITVTATDSNGCSGTGAVYPLTITCPVITVTNPGVNTGTAGVAFSQTFTQSGGQGTITWSETGALPTGITLNPSTGVLSGTTSQVGSFPITVTATDQNGCTGTGATYTLTINCQTITVTNPGINTGTVDAAFSQTFTVTGILGTVTWSETGTLPAGITLNSGTGVLSGTPTVPGSFPITVKATDTNGCFGTSSYTLTINCQTITVTNPGVNTGTVDAPFSQTFTQTGVGTHTPATFTINSGSLPSGLSLSSAGVLSGTPLQNGSFPITVKVTDANGCTGIGATYTLTIACQTITVTNPGVNTGTAGVAFSQTFTQSGVGTHTPATFTTASTLPTGFTLSTSGVLSGTTTQHGSFPIVVTVTDANGCTGTGATYNLSIACNPISVTNPVITSGTVASPFSQTFTQSGSLGTPSFTTASTLPTGLTLHSATGVLDGTPTQSGSFPIVVTVTDSNGCTGTGSTYTLVIACNVITVTNPGVNTGTAGVAFSQTFTQTGGNGTIVWSETGTLPTGISLNSSTGTLFGTTSQVGSFPITVKATDANGCIGTSNYTLTINCQTITVTNPGVNTVQAGTAFDQTFTATGILGTVTWSETGALPSGITLNSTTGHLAGTTNVVGSFPITVTATDTNGCSGTGATYTLTVTCPTILVTRTGGGSFPAGIFNSAYTGQSVTASGSAGPFTFAVTVGSLPTGLLLSSGGAISGTPTATGVFNFTVTATDTVNNCTGSQAFSISIAPVAVGDSYPAASHIVDNTQFVITGGTTVSPATPFVGSVTNLITNDLPSGGVTATTGTFATSGGGSVTIAADGTFIYTPKANPAAAAVTSDSFTYTVVSNGVTSAAATVNLTLANRVWYVKNNGAAGNGQSQNPFNTLAAAQAASLAGDIIYVYNGDGLTTGQTAGITLKNNQQLIGEGVALVVNTVTLNAAGTKPQITNVAVTSDVVTLADGNTVSGLTVTGATRDGIAGNTHAGFTGDSLTIQTSTNSGLHLTSMTGTVTVTNATFSGANGTGLDINNGTAAITLDATNSITANAGKRSVSIQNRPVSAGLITIGATITDNGTGILVNSNASGTIAFTGAQTLATTTNTGVNLTTNTGTTINFSGTLNITTTTGTAFNATGNGTVGVSGTANVTTGAAATGINLNGVTSGGITFSSVNTTGATTGVSLTSLGNGNVTINGGTISGGTTGLSLNTLGTSTITLAGVTLTGSTTAISGATFGTLSIGASVNVSGVTALNLATGAVSGTFANVTSSGGTNGVNLSAVTGTWGVTAGTLTGATGSTFNATGASAGTVSWGGAITQANAANVVTISGTHTGNINFSGNVQTSGTSTGINISASSGTYNFTGGTSTMTGTGGGITIFNESGSISFGSGFSINGPTTSFKIGGSATNTTANITYSGTITNNVNGGVLLDINSVSGTYSTGTINFNGTSLSGTVAGINGVVSVIKNMTGTLTVNNLSLTSSNNNFANTLVAISGTNTAGTMTFNHLVLSANGNGHTGAGLVDSGTGGTVTVTGTGGASTFDTGSTALSLSGQAMGASTIGTLTCTAAAAAGSKCVSLTSTTGTLTISGGTITGGGGSAFLVSGGSATISDAGAITQNTAGQRAVDIQNTTGGTVTFSAAIGSGGIFLSGNTGATMNFTGLLTLSTGTSPAFTATGAGPAATSGGTVTATNANNTLTSTTGTALTVSNTTIGAGGLVFKSISANGGSNGIFLSNTGSTAGLSVNGDGSNTSVGGNSTGGTISGMVGADGSTNGTGIYLNSTKSVVLRRMTINGTNQNYGIKGFTVNGFTLEYSTVSGTNGTSASADTYGDGSVFFGNASTAGILTSGTFTNNVINGGRARNLSIVNGSTGSVATTTITVKGCNFGAMLNFSDGNQSVAVENRASGTAFNTVFGGPLAGEPNTISNSVSDSANFTGQTGTTMDVVFKNNVLSNNNANNIIGGGSLNLSDQGVMTFDVDSNTMRDANGAAVTFFKASSGTSLTGRFTNNTIGVAAVTDSGSKTANGIFVSAAGTGTMGFTITGNQIHQIHGNSHIWADNTGGSYTANFTIQGNTLDTPGAGWFAGIAITNGANTSSDTINVCATIGGSTVGLKNTLNVAGGLGIIVGSSGANGGHTFNLPTYAGGANLTNVQNFIQGNNAGSFTTTAYADAPATAAAFTGSGSSCPTP